MPRQILILSCIGLLSLVLVSQYSYAQQDPEGIQDYMFFECGTNYIPGSGTMEIYFQLKYFSDNTGNNRIAAFCFPLIITGDNIVSVDTTIAKSYSCSDIGFFDILDMEKLDNLDPTASPFRMVYGAVDFDSAVTGEGNLVRIVLNVNDTGTICIDTTYYNICPLDQAFVTKDAIGYRPGWGGTTRQGYPDGVGICLDVNGQVPACSLSEDCGLVSYWRFNEGSGTTLFDSSGNGNHGTLINGPTWVDGVCGKALQFDGVNDYVNVTNLGDFTQFSVTLWRKSLGNGTGTNPRMVTGSKLDSYGGGDDGFVIEHLTSSQDHVSAWVSPDGENKQVGSVAVPQQTWSFIALTFDGTTACLYKDGALAGSTSFAPNKIITVNKLQIGGNTGGGNPALERYFNGIIDEVKLYNRALNEQEIAQEYQSACLFLGCSQSFADPCLTLCPAGDIPFHVYLRDTLNNPIVSYSNVWLDFTNCSGIVPCTSQTQWPIVYASVPSDSTGKVTFSVKAGGCDTCYAYVYAGCGLIDSVLVKTVDINGDLFVKPTDWNNSLCNDYDCDGAYVNDFAEFNLHQQHVGHSCAADPCLLFQTALTVQPDTGLQVGDTASVCAFLQNNSTGNCIIDSINFYYSGFSVGDTNLALINHLDVNQNLSPGDNLQSCTEYVVPGAGHGCIYARFYTNCCSIYVEAENCVEIERLLCPPDTSFQFLTYVDQAVYYFGQIPIPKAAFQPVIYPAISGAASPGDSFVVTISVDAYLASPGDSFVVYLYLYQDPSFTSLLTKRTYKVAYQAIAGDVSSDCKITLSDVIYLVNYIFNKPMPPGCTNACWHIIPLCMGEVNASGGISLFDVGLIELLEGDAS